MKHYLLKMLLLLSVLTTLSLTASAQVSSTSPLSGTVVDPTGSVVVGATVTVKNPSTGREFSTTTGDTGGFTIPALDNGVYTVRVSASGFKSVVVNAVNVDAGTPANVKVTLAIGATTEEIVI